MKQQPPITKLPDPLFPSTSLFRSASSTGRAYCFMVSALLAERIDALLPQTQCTKCGYDGCLPYARAIANDGENINRCPPGGQAGVRALATDRKSIRLNSRH